MNTALRYAQLISGFLLLSVGALGQSYPSDTAFITSSVQHVTRLYWNSIQEQANLYNGAEYVELQTTNEQHPYFETDDWVIGWIVYDGNFYENQPLMYDITQDKVITEYYNGSMMALVTGKVQLFSINHHTFEFIKNEKVNHTLPMSGLYEILYTGESRLIARREKDIQEKIENRVFERNFESKNRYYLFKSGRYFPVKNKASALKILSDQKHALKQLMKKNAAHFINREVGLIKIVELYDTLRAKNQNTNNP